MKIIDFTCWVVERDAGLDFNWRDGLPSSHSDVPDAGKIEKAVIRMTTDTGLTGWVEIPKGKSVIDTVRRRFSHFIGKNPLMTEHMWNLVWEVDRVEEFPMSSLGLIDILCWDVKSKHSGMPVYQLAGGNDPKIQAYASTVTWDTLEEYEHHINICLDVGFKLIKVHAWGNADRDIELARCLRKWVGPDIGLMFDGSACWDYVDALRVGKVLEEENFLWYEEPMREFYLGAYTKLRQNLSIPIVAAETSDGVHWNMATWIENQALDMTRISSQYKGGITGSLKIAHMSESFGMRAQVHGMGLENAQLCAAISNNDYYEQLVVNEEQIRALPSLGPLAVKDGYLEVSDKPGFGYDLDADELDAIAVDKVSVNQYKFS